MIKLRMDEPFELICGGCSYKILIDESKITDIGLPHLGPPLVELKARYLGKDFEEEFDYNSIDYKLSVMSHFKHGGKIEVKNNRFADSWWVKCESPNWDWPKYNYRIKPEYKEVTIKEIEEKFGCKVKVVDNA